MSRMTRVDVLELLLTGSRGVEEFKRWRQENIGVQLPSLAGAQLPHADLVGIDLRSAFLEGANFDGADLRGAVLQRAQMERVKLQQAKLEEFFRG